jgi:dipeptidyl aminopeptidase/acylaminoacyl peptidase
VAGERDGEKRLGGIVPADLVRAAAVVHPALAPEASWGVVVVRTAAADGHSYQARLVKVTADDRGKPDAPAMFLTQGPRDDTPIFSADGRWLWFVRHRTPEEGDLVMRLPTGGGEAEPVGPPFWGLAGMVALPGHDAVIVVARGLAEGRSPTFPRAYTRRQWQLDGVGYFPREAQNLWWVAPGETPERLTDGPYDCEVPAVSPDGTFAVLSRVAGEQRAELAEPDLFRLDLRRGGPLVRLTEGPGPRHAPVVTTSGRIYCLGHDRAFGPATQGRLLRWDGRGGLAVVSLPNDVAVGQVIGSDWNAAARPARPVALGETVWVLGSRRGRTEIWRVDEARVDPVAAQVAVVDDLAVAGTPAAPVVLHTGSSLDRPPEAYWMGSDGTGPVTRFNAWARPRLAPVRPMAVKAEDGVQIPAFVVGGDDPEPRPLILYVHGGPHNAYGETVRFDAQVMASRGYRVLLVNPRGSMSYGQAFADAVRGDWGGGDMRDLLAVLEALLAEGGVDPQRLYVTGASYGGFMTAWLVGHTERFAAASTVVPVINLLSFFGTSDIGWWFVPGELGATPWTDRDLLWRRSPLAYADQVRTPTQVMAGEEDRRCPIEQAEQFYTALLHYGVETEFLRYPGAHGFGAQGRPVDRMDRLERLLDWFDRHRRPDEKA